MALEVLGLGLMREFGKLAYQKNAAMKTPYIKDRIYHIPSEKYNSREAPSVFINA